MKKHKCNILKLNIFKANWNKRKLYDKAFQSNESESRRLDSFSLYLV